ncbi:MAG: Flp family type IVb pilin [Caldilineaceae bacterium]|nr:Flp family type IVb pilin [Caldilineaceae bacterium]
MLVVENFLATLKREEGQGMAEYGLILALIAVVVIVALNILGPAIAALMTEVSGSL